MTVRLARVAVENWEKLDGYAVGHNMPDLRELPLERFANFVYWFVTREAAAEEVEKFRARLWVPPKGVTPTSGPWSREAELSAFAAVRNRIGAK